MSEVAKLVHHLVLRLSRVLIGSQLLLAFEERVWHLKVRLGLLALDRVSGHLAASSSLALRLWAGSLLPEVSLWS